MKTSRVLYIWIIRHRLGLILIITSFIFIVLNLNLLGYTRDMESPEKLREEILRLSEIYVNVLSKESEDIVNGPFSGRLTGYDLKKALAVILEDLLNRIHKLERELDQLRNSNCSKQPLAKDEKVLSNDKGQMNNGLMTDTNCELTDEEEKEYPNCKSKLAWMATFWSSDPCYSEYNVDGSLCSMRIYLSEVESWCPPLPERLHVSKTHDLVNKAQASWNFELEYLIGLLQDPGHRMNYDWIRKRIKLLWDRWVYAAKNLTLKQDFTNRPRMRILVHLGFLSTKSGFKIPETASKGGPLGELVQWSDIISALYLLGHNLTITSEFDDLAYILRQLPDAESQCQVRSKLPVDMIYTDIVGLTQFKKKVKKGYGKFSCLLRIIDTFGTEAMFNHATYSKTHKKTTNWGKQNLNLRQFFTMFPHSPDNSFMGFVVEQHLSLNEYENITKKQQAVVYGKVSNMWKGKEKYLSVVKKYVDVHGTVFVDGSQVEPTLPDFVTNHGILSGPELHKLLLESKLFLGLGFPYEGPAPLEAIAQGCVFINPSFDPPHNRENTPFFKGKPTMRKVTSQHPYAEDFISEPHVYTVDINNMTEVDAAIRKALEMVDSKKVGMYLPYEFTYEGMLQRLNAYIKHQDFCSPHPEVWPPLDSVTFIVSAPGKSCKDACWEIGQICEYSHFSRANNQAQIEETWNSTCSRIHSQSNIYFPAFEPETQKCFLQEDPLLFSCVGEVEGVSRVCPCRDFIKGQTALCRSCL